MNGRMATFEEALKAVLAHARARPSLSSRLEDSPGRVLREDVRSGVDMPPFDKACMDGYAVRSADLVRVPRKLALAGSVMAGRVFRGVIGKGRCVRIMTGAPLPPGADAVVMLEETSEKGGEVEFYRTPRKSSNIRRRGQDMRRGRLIVGKGAVLSVQHIAALAAAGRASVKVGAMPRAAVLSTGEELTAAGRPLGPGRIYDSNGPMLESLLKSDGVVPARLGIARDEERSLAAALEKALRSDLVLVSGGVSMGDRDLVPAVLRRLGVRKIFHKVRIKPGKPLFFGVKGRTLVFGIPGNPAAGFLSYLAFIRPAIHKMSGRPRSMPEFMEGSAAAPVRSGDRRYFALVTRGGRAAPALLSPVPCGGSGDIFALARADGFMMVKEGKDLKKNGKAVFLAWK